MSMLEKRLEFLREAESFKREFERTLQPLEMLDPSNPVTFVSVGGGELGDLAVTAAKRLLGGPSGGVRTVVFDRYEGCPAQDSADFFECFDMMDGDLLEERIRKYIPDPSKPHAIYLEIEKADTRRACMLGVREGYRVMSTPYGPLICMDRHLTKLMFDRLGIPRVEWEYASSQEEIERIAKDFNLPIIVKPVMTSSGHGTSIVRDKRQLKGVYEHAVKHARGRGTEVIVEKFLPELKERGTEITQLVIRHFDENGNITTSLAPPVEHQRPAATYHESWLPATISDLAVKRCQEGARKIAEFIGGLGVFAVEQFVIGDTVYNNEVANRPHDTAMITRWMLNTDEGALQLLSSIGLPITDSDLAFSRTDVYGVAHVVLAPDDVGEGTPVVGWDAYAVRNYIKRKGYRGEVWYFGKPTAYPHRRMGLAVGFHEELSEARRVAEDIAHFAEKAIRYGG